MTYSKYKHRNSTPDVALNKTVFQNLLFKSRSYNILIRTNTNKNPNSENNCCLLHSLLNIEEESKNAFLSSFLSFYDSNLLNFIHQCTKFDNDNNNINSISDYPDSNFLDCYKDIKNNLSISIKEIFKIISFTQDNEYISQNNFFKTFELLFKEMKMNSNNFKKLLHENKVINVLIRSFDIDKNEFKSKFRKIISNNENDVECDEYDENKNFVNSGNYFYKSSLRKKLENNGNKNYNEINIENNSINQNSESNQGIIIFKNYNNSDNN